MFLLGVYHTVSTIQYYYNLLSGMVIRFSFVCVLHWYIMRKDRCNASLAYYWQVQQISTSVAVQALHGVAVYNMFLTRSHEY